MTVKEIMSTNVATLNKEDTAYRAATIMKDNNIGAIPVLNGSDVCGIVTDRDIILRCVAKDKNANDCKISDIMTTNTSTASADWNINEALEVMARQQVRRLPVTENGKLTGIVSLADIARQRQNPELARAISEISLP